MDSDINPTGQPIGSLLYVALGKVIEMLLSSGYQKFKEVLEKYTSASKERLIAEFTDIWELAAIKCNNEALSKLLAHRPFQESCVKNLLDPIDGFDVGVAADFWGEKFPLYERDLKLFFYYLQKGLSHNEIWKELLDPTQEKLSDGVLSAESNGKSQLDEIISSINIYSEIAIVPKGNTFFARNVNIFTNPSQFPETDNYSEEQLDGLLKEYLDWVVLANDQIRLFGIESMIVSGGKPNKKLSDIYMPITLRRVSTLTRDEIEEIEKYTELSEKIKKYLEVTNEKQKEGMIIDINEKLLLTNDKLAIIGGPGSGKSTLLSYLCLVLAKNALSGEELITLPKGKDILIPLLLPLRYFKRYREICDIDPSYQLRYAPAGTLRGFIPWYINHYSNREFPIEFIHGLLKGGKCLLMFDGLDEVTDQEERGQIREEVERLTCNQFPDNNVIVTAREAGYKKDAVFNDSFVRLDVQPLDRHQINKLCENWCIQLYPLEIEKRKKEIVNAVFDINDRTRKNRHEALISTPLMTSMVISVKYYETELPRERARLYEAVIRVILQAQYLHEDSTRVELTNKIGDWEEQREWLSELALYMHEGGEASAVISEEQLKIILKKFLPDDKIDQFIHHVRLRGGIFEEKANMFQFIHLSFQEFLAARRLAKIRSDAFVILSPHIKDDWWREVFMLVYGFLKMDFPEGAQSYLSWLRNIEESDSEKVLGIELACLALLDIEKYQKELIEQTANELISEAFDVSKNITPALRVKISKTLSNLGDPRFNKDCFYLPDDPMLGFIKVPSSSFVMGSDCKIVEYMRNNESPKCNLYLPDFFIAKYPVIESQFKEFIRVTGYDGYSESYFKGLLNCPVRHVTWYEAKLYCDWLNEELFKILDTGNDFVQRKNNGWKIDLPSEAEWEKAAKGDHDERLFPWGDDFEKSYANVTETDIKDVCSVGCFLDGVSPYGVFDMSGNVWEWTRSVYWEYPYRINDGREKRQATGDHVLRGGAYNVDHTFARCAYRFRYETVSRYHGYGFRIAFVPPEKK